MYSSFLKYQSDFGPKSARPTFLTTSVTGRQWPSPASSTAIDPSPTVTRSYARPALIEAIAFVYASATGTCSISTFTPVFFSYSTAVSFRNLMVLGSGSLLSHRTSFGCANTSVGAARPPAASTPVAAVPFRKLRRVTITLLLVRLDASTSVHLEHRARQHRPLVGGEEQGAVRDVLRRGEAPPRDAPHQRLAHPRAVGGGPGARQIGRA